MAGEHFNSPLQNFSAVQTFHYRVGESRNLPEVVELSPCSKEGRGLAADQALLAVVSTAFWKIVERERFRALSLPQ